MTDEAIHDETGAAGATDDGTKHAEGRGGRWEKPPRTRTSDGRGRRRTAAAAEPAAAPPHAPPAGSAPEPDVAARPVRRARPTPVPRDVPCEWTPAEADSAARTATTPADAAVRAPAGAPIGVPPAATVREAAAAIPAAAPAQETRERAPEPRQDMPRGETRGDGYRGGDAPRHEAPRFDGPRADGPRPDGPRFDGPRNDRYDFRRERFNRPDRFRRDPREAGPAGPQGGVPGPGPQGSGFSGGGQNRPEFRRLSRYELRRLNRRERMLLRQQEDPYEPQAMRAAGEPRPDAPPPLRMSTLQALDVPPLLAQAEELGIVDELGSLGKHDIVYELLRQHTRRGGQVVGEGVLELMPDGFGFLRNPYNDYHTCPEDPCVLPAIVRRFGLRAGDRIVGPVRPPMDQRNRYFTLVDVETVNALTPAEARRIAPFESLTPTFPDRRIHLETSQDEVAMRVTNIFTPIGFGQRGLIVAPPRTGKTVLMQKMANAISANHPSAHLIILLIDERPEEVTDMERNTKAHVCSSTFDEPPERHVQVADIVIEMSRRMVELGKDVVILLDSITRLARAYNTLQPNSGKILSGGVDANALQKPKRFFGAARNIEGGGSLTIVATALVDTGSRMDEVIFEEFKGTGNMELCLDRALVDKRVFPALNIEKSGTRKEELLLHAEELARTWVLRRALNGVPPVEAMEMIVKRLKNTGTNAEFLMSMKE